MWKKIESICILYISYGTPILSVHILSHSTPRSFSHCYQVVVEGELIPVMPRNFCSAAATTPLSSLRRRHHFCLLLSKFHSSLDSCEHVTENANPHASLLSSSTPFPDSVTDFLASTPTFTPFQFFMGYDFVYMV